MRIARKGGRILRKLVNGVWRLCTTCCGTGGVSVVCCPSSSVPTTLSGNVSSAACSCIDGAPATAVYNSGTGQWDVTVNFTCNGVPATAVLHFYCNAFSSTWFQSYDLPGGFNCQLTVFPNPNSNLPFVQCSPFIVELAGPIGSGSPGCPFPCPGASWTLTLS